MWWGRCGPEKWERRWRRKGDVAAVGALGWANPARMRIAFVAFLQDNRRG